MKLLPLTLTVLCLASTAAQGEEVCNIVKGAVLIAQDDKNTFLGKITNSYDSESIFNEYGTYGSQYEVPSIS